MTDMLQHMSDMSTRAAAPQQINLQIQNEATVRAFLSGASVAC